MPKSSAVPVVPIAPVDPVQFVQIRSAQPTPKNLTRERAPEPVNDAPLVRGTTPEKIVSPPAEKPKSSDAPAPDPAAAQPTAPPTTTSPPIAASDTVAPPAQTAGGKLRSDLRNLGKFLNAESYDNPHGGQNNYSPDINFDDKGIDFGPWLARFKAQIERNWRPPEAMNKGHVVFQFYVLRNGTILEIKMLQPSGVESYDTSALGALKLSNPTMKLPDEYPDDRVLFTVTFHYNENIR